MGLDQEAEVVVMVAGQREWEAQGSVRKYGVRLRQCWYPVSGGKYRNVKCQVEDNTTMGEILRESPLWIVGVRFRWF